MLVTLVDVPSRFMSAARLSYQASDFGRFPATAVHRLDASHGVDIRLVRGRRNGQLPRRAIIDFELVAGGVEEEVALSRLVGSSSRRTDLESARDAQQLFGGSQQRLKMRLLG